MTWHRHTDWRPWQTLPHRHEHDDLPHGHTVWDVFAEGVDTRCDVDEEDP